MNTSQTNRSHLSSASPDEPFGRAREFQIATDPMQTMWDALDHGGYQPRGDRHSFMTRCPIHGGTSRNLRVTEASSGGVLVYCLAHPTTCTYQAIVDKLAIDPRALRPPGHHRAEKPKPRPVKALSPGAAWLDAMTTAGFGWHAQLLGVECPYCSDPNAYITVHDAGGIDVKCPSLCSERNVREAIETRAAIAEKGVDLR